MATRKIVSSRTVIAKLAVTKATQAAETTAPPSAEQTKKKKPNRKDLEKLSVLETKPTWTLEQMDRFPVADFLGQQVDYSELPAIEEWLDDNEERVNSRVLHRLFEKQLEYLIVNECGLAETQVAPVWAFVLSPEDDAQTTVSAELGVTPPALSQQLDRAGARASKELGTPISFKAWHEAFLRSADRAGLR